MNTLPMADSWYGNLPQDSAPVCIIIDIRQRNQAFCVTTADWSHDHDLLNINSEAYKYTRSATPSRSKSRLIDIIPIKCVIYTHNFYTTGKLRISAFQQYAACKDPSSCS